MAIKSSQQQAIDTSGCVSEKDYTKQEGQQANTQPTQFCSLICLFNRHTCCCRQ